MTQEELNIILENHRHWLNEDCEGWKDMRANLESANLIYTNLSFANLEDANLKNANIKNAYLDGSNLVGANLIGANLENTHFEGTNLYNTCLDKKEEIRKGKVITEPIIGWKQCWNKVLVKLEIPRGAIVFSINNKKCRTNKAKVLEIIGADRAFSTYKYFSYYVGDEINVYNFDCQYNVECGAGIHFFNTREEAENYFSY